jgi:uncharacterized protein YkwD
MHIYSGTIKGTMNVITNLLVLLIVTSFILPASAIMYASGSTDNGDSSSGGSTDNGDNGDDSSSGGSTDNGDSSSGGSTDNGDSSSDGSTDNGDDSSSGGSTDNGDSSSDGSTENNTASRSGFRESNDTGNATQESNSTGNAYCETCNNDIYNGTGDLKSMVLAVHNRERAAVGVPDLVWNNALAADAQTWAEHLATLGKIIHCSQVPGCDPKNEGENIASGGHTTTVPIAQNMQGWVAEKNVFQGLPSATGTDVVGHYTQMIWKSTTDVGCGTASGGPNDNQGWDILVCRYLPWGNTGPNPFE